MNSRINAPGAGGDSARRASGRADRTASAAPRDRLPSGIAVNMDGQGYWRDNIFVEPRTIKYEEVYLHAYDSVSAATAGLTRYLTVYNTRRPHSSLADQTPDEAYFTSMSRHHLSRAIRVGALALMLAVEFADADGQAPTAGGSIEGVVTDTSLVPLAEATVLILGSNLRLVTGVNGRFRINDMAPGEVIFLIRRMGFEPLSARVLVTTLDTAHVSFALERAATTLDAVMIAAKPLSLAMTEFEERRKFGTGQFMTQAEIEKRNVVATSDLLRTFSGFGKRGATSAMAGCSRPAVFLDGIKMPPSVNIDDIAIPKELAGIEFYTGPAQAPVQFGRAGCGIILLWTRIGSP